MSEPMWLMGDDAALGLADECDNCNELERHCVCGEPDRMWGDDE